MTDRERLAAEIKLAYTALVWDMLRRETELLTTTAPARRRPSDTPKPPFVQRNDKSI